MARSRFSALICLCITAWLGAVSWVVAIPDRLGTAWREFVALVLRPEPFAIARLLGRPVLACEGPPDRSIAPALAQQQRHEAGLARLGAVRHR